MNSLRSVVFVVSVGGIAISLLAYRLLSRKRTCKKPVENEWHPIGLLKEINLFPVKSCGPVQLEKSDVDEYGLNFKGFCNRRLLVLTESDKMGYAGVNPQLLSIKPKIISEELISLHAPNIDPLVLNFKEIKNSGGKIQDKQLKGYRMKLVECKPEHHLWFSRAVLQRDSGLRLFLTLDLNWETCWWRNVEREFFPLMIMHDKSVLELNSRLTERNQAHHLQFRGNLLIESLEHIEAFDEDQWLFLKIGNDVTSCVILRFNSPCLRCILPNIDIHTCTRNAELEPLRTLRKYRLHSHPKDPEMGVYFDVYKKGTIMKGDPVYVQYK